MSNINSSAPIIGTAGDPSNFPIRITARDGSLLSWVDENGFLGGNFRIGTGGSGTPGGSDTQIQFNNADAFAGDPGFTWNTSTGSLNAQSLSGQSSINLDGVSENVSLTAANFITFSSVGVASIFSNTELDLDATGPIQIGLQNSAQIGFFNTPAISKPTITGAKAGNTALTLSLLAALVAFGLVADGTT